MPKTGIQFFVFLMLLLFISSCQKKPKATVEKISPNPVAKAAFDSLQNRLNEPRNDSLVISYYKIAQPLLDDEGLLLLYRKMGEYYFQNEVNDSALVYFTHGLNLARKLRDQYYTAVFHLMRGSVYIITAEYEPAREELKLAYNLSMAIDSIRLQIRSSRNLGNAYLYLGSYDLSLEYYFKTLELSTKAGYKPGITSALNNIGNIYMEIKNYNQALEYLHQSESMAKANGYKHLYSTIINNLGEVYSRSGRYDSALVYYNLALEGSATKFNEGIYLGNIAELYLKTDSLDKSEDYYKKSLLLANKTGDKEGIAICNLGLAEVKFNSNKKKEGLEYLKYGKKISEEIGKFNLLSKAYSLYSTYYLSINKIEEAYAYLKKEMAVKDSINTKENNQNISRLENSYKEAKNLKRLELLKEKQKGYYYLIALGLFALLIIFIVVIISYRQSLKSELLLKEKNLQIETSKKILEEKHQQLLRSQEQLNIINKGKDDFLTIISHDLKNPLSSIRGFTELLLRSYDTLSDEQRKNFLNEVFDSIERMSLLINNVLYWVRSQTHGIKVNPVKFNLGKRVEENISIYRLMLANKEIEIINAIPDSIIVMADNNVFDMVLRNLLSNALKFTPKKGKIHISSTVIDSIVILSVHDTGIGIAPDKIKLILEHHGQYSTTGTSHEQGTGLGLGLVHQFIQQTGGTFEINSEPGKGTDIRFSLNVVS